MTDFEALAKVEWVPVRHHSPRSSAVLSRVLDEIRPSIVLVEGPEDATSLVDVLVDRKTRPPVAILGYRTDGAPASSVWPFASYSPEYVALRWAAEHGARAEFIDIPVSRSLASNATRGGSSEADEASEGHFDEVDRAARARGFRSFEEFWEASFEAPAYAPEQFRSLILAYADVVRTADRSAFHRARDAFMARRIAECVRESGEGARIVGVVGAAHAAAFVAKDVDAALERTLPDPVASAVTLIPYSFPRLAEQLGYGAGNRAPEYYQRAHDGGCSFRRATLEVLIELAQHLRLRGFSASLADAIEAFRLAVRLAEIRGKADPGLDEVRDAAVATLCRGDATHIDGFLWPTVVGRHVGQVADRIGKNSLQEEFWRTLAERALPDKDELVAFSLRLTNEVEVGTSVFLHRLRIADVPYATYMGTSRTSSGAVEAAAGGYSALARSREAWEAQWTPSTDVALVEKIVLGNSLADVAARVLGEQLGEAKSTGDAADVLLEGVVANVPPVVAAALEACERSAAVDDDLPSLARACRALAALVSFGSSRALSNASEGADDAAESTKGKPPELAISTLCQKTFDRAVLRAGGASFGTDEAVAPVKVALRTLHDIAISLPLVDREAWLAAARALHESYEVNPGVSGLVTGLLYLAQSLSDAEVVLVVAQRLGNSADPLAAASFLGGFFEVNTIAIVKSRPVVAALDAFLCGMDPERFRDALPVVRRAFSALGKTERRYLLENLLAVRGIGDRKAAAKAVLDEKDKEKLRAMSEDLSKAMDDIDDLL